VQLGGLTVLDTRDPEDTREIAKLEHNEIRRLIQEHRQQGGLRHSHASRYSGEQGDFLSDWACPRFRNTEEYYGFLDLPLDDKKLKRAQEIAEFFRKYKNRPLVRHRLLTPWPSLLFRRQLRSYARSPAVS
jgi:hypothetical protein